MPTVPSTNIVECCNHRVENKYKYRWSIHNFNCQENNGAVNLPSTQFNFSLGSSVYNGRLEIAGDDCNDRKCVLKVVNQQSRSWKLHVKMWIEGLEEASTHGSNLNFTAPSGEMSLKDRGACLLLKTKPKNIVTIICEITQISFVDKTIIDKKAAQKQE